MISLLATILLTPVAYNLPSTPLNYTADINFDGFIPMLGGIEAKVDVALGFEVKGMTPEEGKPRVQNELTALEVKMDGLPLPFTADNAKQYFPTNTITITPQGKVIKNDAKEIPLPVRLPGLDVKRIPDITFIPIEFPEQGVELNKEFEFKKRFGTSDMTYKVTPTSITDTEILLDVKIAQTYELLEDAALGVVEKEIDAVNRVTTDLTGTGKVVFDRTKGLARSTTMNVEAYSAVKDLKTEKVTKRKLITTFNVKLKQPKG